MSKLERIYHLHSILSQRRTPIARQALMDEIGCSQATLYRLIADLRDLLGAPIEQDPEKRGFYYERHANIRPFELPGIWLSSAELQALLLARDVLASVQPGLLEDELSTLQSRISNLLEQKGLDQDTQSQRIRILHQASRLVPGEVFRQVLGGLVQRQRLEVVYHGRGRDRETRREISPQRLTSYRNNWYLDAWCHWRNGLRSFALERLRDIRLLASKATDVDEGVLGLHFTSAYGIFSGPAENEAVLRFSTRMARWVAEELWHSRQRGRWLDDGRYELCLPFGRSDELVMDILRYGADAEVVAPETLRKTVQERLRLALVQYSEL